MRSAREIVQTLTGLIPPAHGLLDRPRRIDLLMLVVITIGILFEVGLVGTPAPVLVGSAALIYAVGFAYRRVRPLLVIVAVATTSIVGDLVALGLNEPTEGTFVGGLAAIATLYAMGRWAPPNVVRLTIIAGVIVIPATAFLNPGSDYTWTWHLGDAAANAATVAVGVVVRAQQALKSERVRAELAEERNLLANDIHDSIAHHMSAIAIRAEGARQLTDPAERDEALDAIKQSASAGLSEVRHLVASIRSPLHNSGPQPGLGDIEELARESSTTSLRVDVKVDAATTSVAGQSGAVAYAIVREALTNVRRHATSATRAVVEARASEGHLDLRITDNGTAVANGQSAGFGINVMKERANSAGGALSAGPNPDGGWLVSARLPLNQKDNR